MMALSRLAGLFASVAVIAGCVTRNAGDVLGEKAAEAIVTHAIIPPLELSMTAGEFHRAFERWPTNYSELCSYSESDRGITLSNYERVEFTPTADGGLKILALARGMTNQMTLSLPEESQK